ncbi:MAG: YbaB/EbfC family nucleoid-associated protein [Bacteroidia bacterium]|nr:YbaB/EbfC family nucleoid-associated protein [Bacteroidia bacterium]
MNKISVNFVVSVTEAMFDLNLPDMLGKIKEMQANLQKAKDSLNDIQVEAEAGGGMVKVIANCNKQIIKLSIDPELFDDKEMMEDLICAAVNKAMTLADERSRQEMANLTQGMLPNIPGFDLSKLGL